MSSHPNSISTSPLPLSPIERQIFDTLLSVITTYNLNLTLRVAGGWVRDKVLLQNGIIRELRNVDIDIALDTMLGREFAEIVQQYLLESHSDSSHKHSVAIIQRNPDQSKHLETARMMMFGLWIDLVNLRTEEYSNESRIPLISIGTPHEDALRRDLTINACFYNINLNIIEDFTGEGLNDLHRKLIKTPLPPLTTLLDDPLRALRAIRFASRLQFCIDPNLKDAMRDTRVHLALMNKVSRERIGTEIDAILVESNPVLVIHALGLIVQLNLFDTVFELPLGLHQKYADPRAKTPSHRHAFESYSKFAWNCMRFLIEHCALKSVSKTLFGQSEPQEIDCGVKCENAWVLRVERLSALTMPLMGWTYSGKKGKDVEVIKYVLSERLKVRVKEVDVICKIHKGVEMMVDIGEIRADSDEFRLKVGLLMRCVEDWW
eukprot:CAMPEP_0182448604 /NCGR_PEP_ID=MMETSP1172-20130603/28429_1 /TAXON_ID=708627 /ORGANISM="Timspurckia oligopyrenoides, Strain CCMP3278" /LENGTH=432 /DNA_ID=CAMNT_0024645539 /DNA_START=313 /DNA_END=1608 /DNA_ORIENTATION=-